MARDPNDVALYKHKQWLGYLQPVGLVVSPPAMVNADLFVNTDVAEPFQKFTAMTSLELRVGQKDQEQLPVLRDLSRLFVEVFGWHASDLIPAEDSRASHLMVYLQEYSETLRPTFAVAADPNENPLRWQMLIQTHPSQVDFDKKDTQQTTGWNASIQARFERLLRETQIPTGILFNQSSLRLVYAPRGESAGYLTFPIAEMLTVPGRLVFAAMYMLLRAESIFNTPTNKSLFDALANSRKYQSNVSTELAKQVLLSLYELVRGFQAANAIRNGELLKEVLAEEPDEVYAGLLTVLLRLVFLLYAEDRGLMSTTELYTKHYSVTGLFEKLRADAGRYPDTMDQRFGAWARLLSLFRMVHTGAEADTNAAGVAFALPARHGFLFDPSKYPFLEGWASRANFDLESIISPPAVSDGVVFRVLEKLMILDGERLSYRALDVEQIGSVYEAMMGFRIEVSQGPSIAIKPKKTLGAPVTINLEALLKEPAKTRVAKFQEWTDQTLTPKEGEPFKTATTIDDLVAVLEKKIAKEVTPNIVPPGSMILQPSDERRRSGSHYTPRSLTEPIVRKALEPILKALTPSPSPEGEGGKAGGRTPPLLGEKGLGGEGQPDAIAGRGRNIPEPLLKRARELRQTQTPAEQLIWECVRDRQLHGAKFRRQHNLGPFIADFYCHEFRLCLELDGGIHSTPDQQTKDKVRDQWMKENNIRVIRLTNEEVFSNPTTALERIAEALTPGPSPSGEGGKASDQTPPLLGERGLGGEGCEGLVPKPSQILNLKICDPAMGSGAFLVEACRQLGEVLVKAWHTHKDLPQIPPDEDEFLHAQRLVAQRCLYGVDKNPMAVDLAKLSLWLVTLAKEHPFTFVDHTLRCGDSLVGLTKKQIIDFHWLECKQPTIGQDVVEERLVSATKFRQKILDAGDYILPGVKEHNLKLADEALGLARFAGNLVIAAFFAADKDGARKATRDNTAMLLSEYLRTGNMAVRPTQQELALTTGDIAIYPFHWEIEYPEVFTKKDGGFDCIVGNPPFMGGAGISTAFGDSYLAWLKTTHLEAGGQADLVAYFFRQAFNLLRKGGTFGLIATNTIAQGDTRSSGLRWICNNTGTIYSAKRRYKWPGLAAVVVSVIHAAKGTYSRAIQLDERKVEKITAFLFHAGGNDDPLKLLTNLGRNFHGVSIYGPGFSFDDTDKSGVANSLTTMNELIAKDSKNAERIFPYIGGQETNEDPRQNHHRYVIDFGKMTLEETSNWPDLLKIVKEKVKPQRDKDKRETRKNYWWRFGEAASALQVATVNLDRVLAISRVGEKLSFVMLPSDIVFADSLIIFPLSTFSAFAVLQARPHEIWARFFGSSLGTSLRYTPSDCFETFPFPAGVLEANATPSTSTMEAPVVAPLIATLESVGQEYYEYRAALMVENNEGLTKTYNRFHDPEETSDKIVKLRALHDAMDRAVLQAYGPPFSELVVPPCEFLLDYEEEEEEALTPTLSLGRGRKKPYRYRWPDTFRDEILALLLELNKQRAEAEKKSTPVAKKKTTRAKGKKENPDQPKIDYEEG